MGAVKNGRRYNMSYSTHIADCIMADIEKQIDLELAAEKIRKDREAKKIDAYNDILATIKTIGDDLGEVQSLAALVRIGSKLHEIEDEIHLIVGDTPEKDPEMVREESRYGEW